MSLKSFISGKAVRFKRIIAKQWFSVILGIVLTWFYLVISISINESSVRTSEDIYIIGCELFTESGPAIRLEEAVIRHEINLKECKTYLKQKTAENTIQKVIASAAKLPGARWLFGDSDDYSATKGINEALNILEQTKRETSHPKMLEAIWGAGEHLLGFREKMIDPRRMGRIGVGFYKNERIPQDLQRAVEAAIGISQAKLNDFEAGKSWERAWALCEANRKSILLLFLARSAYKEEIIAEHINNLKIILDKSRTTKKNYADMLPESERNPVKKLVTLFAESDRRRLGIVEAIQHNDMGEALYLIWEAKEEAKRNRSLVLDIIEAEEFEIATAS